MFSGSNVAVGPRFTGIPLGNNPARHNGGNLIIHSVEQERNPANRLVTKLPLPCGYRDTSTKNSFVTRRIGGLGISVYDDSRVGISGSDTDWFSGRDSEGS